MNKILSILLMIPILLSISSISEQSFIDSCKDGYNEYCVVLDTETEVGDLTICFGSVKDKYYLSCYLLNTNSENYWISVYVNDTLTSFVPDGGVVEGYSLRIKENNNIKVLLRSDNNEINVYEVNSSDLINKLKDNKVQGNGTGKFPNNKKEMSLLTQLRVAIIIFLVCSALIATALIILYKKAAGRFNKNYKEEPIGFPGEEESENNAKEEDVIDVDNFSVEQDNKQELMDKYFEEYRHGDITEDELNEKLKKLWWKNND